MKVFLTANWKNLLNITYPVPPETLEARVPPGVDLEVEDGQAFVSLVAFEFLNTRLKGIKIPFHVNFPEVNLRYYVNLDGRRGVAFLKEFVPRFWIAWVARTIYNEPYESIPMSCDTRKSSDDDGEKIQIVHTLKKGGKEHRIEVKASCTLSLPSSDTEAHFFKEHDIGFGVTRKGETLFYRVEHPYWELYKLEDYTLDLDFGELYGDQWAFLADTEPHCALLAKGSDIKVYHAHKLEELSQMEWNSE